MNTKSQNEENPESEERQMSADLIKFEGWNCFGCGHRHAGKSWGYICIGCPCQFIYCEGCETAIDPETCGCGGSLIDGSGHESHTIIPMGCQCYRADRMTAPPKF